MKMNARMIIYNQNQWQNQKKYNDDQNQNQNQNKTDYIDENFHPYQIPAYQFGITKAKQL